MRLNSNLVGVRTLLVLGMAATISAGCTDDMTEPSRGASVQIAQGAVVRTTPGDTVRLSASVLDSRGQPVPGAVVRWTSAEETVARVDASGLVVAVSAGNTTVTATTASGASADLIVTVGPIRKINDRTTLTALYEATDGPNWTENQGWLTDAPLGNWHGVETDDQGRVIGISLNSNDLTGELPSELGDLTNLLWLNLNSNDLMGELPSELGNLTNLQGLYLTFNDLTGEIPPELGNLTNLRELWLLVNDLTGEMPPELGNLANLREFLLNSNALTGEIPPELGNLANLQSLNLGSNALTGEIPPELGNLANLQGINLSRNALTGEIPPELGNLANLQRLGLGSNALTGEMPPELGTLTNLQGLYLGGNALTGEVPPELGNLANLEGLHLSSNALTGEIPPELGNLANLQQLSLTLNDLTGEIPPELGNLANLQWLGLSFNDLTGRVPAELASLGNLEHIRLNGNRLTGALPAGFADLTNLQSMTWRCGRFGLCAPGTQQFMDFAEAIDYDGPFCHEADADMLESLYSSAGGLRWTSSDGWLQPGSLSNWHGVETDAAGRVVALDLSENGLSGVLPWSLSLLKSLREFRIGGNSELGGRLALAMTSLSLRTLRYDDTTVCAPADPSFRNWLQSISSHAGTGIECPPLTDRDGLEVLYYSTHGPNWASKGNWMTDAPLMDWYGVRTDNQGRVIGISLSSNALTGEIPSELGNLTNLQWLHLSENTLTGEVPPELGNLATLQSLWLYSNALTGEIPPELGNLTNLQWLSLGKNSLTGKIPSELGKLTNLRELWLHSNSLTGKIPSELGKLTNLRNLWLHSNALTGDIPPELGNVTNLRRLNLNSNELTGEMPPQLGNLANLRELWLHSNELTGEMPPQLGNLANMRVLWLHSNELTGDIPPELGNVANMWRLDLSDNALTGEVPPELGNLANLQHMSLANNAGMSGALPAAWTSLDMSELLLGGTGLCAPPDAAFQSWLRSILWRRVSVCAERAGGEARAEAYIVQATQSFEFPVPLVAGRPGLLRVFASVRYAGAPVPAARATFYQRDGSERTIEVPSGSGRLSAELQEGSLRGSANVEVPGDVLRPGVEMVVEVDPADALDPGLGVPARIPAAGRTALEVYELPSFDVTVVPFLWEADPDSSILDMTRGMTPDDSLFEETRGLLPVGAMTVTVHEPVWSSSNSAYDLLDETKAIRTLENGGGYWMGTLPDATGARGVAWSPGRSQFSVPRSNVIAHEFGHNMHLGHAPCGGASGPDPVYPDLRGRVGAWGWDRRSGRLVPPSRRDLMSYCDPAWIGDYHFARSFRWRMHDEAGVAAFQGPPTRVLLLWGGADADGTPFLNPAFVVDDARASVPDGTGEWLIVGEAEDGRALFDRAFEMAEIADGDGRQSFVFALPTEASWADALSRIVLTGPDGEVTMDAQSGPATALLRDPATGRVRGILRDWPDPATQADPAAALPETGLEVQVSRGVPAPDAWRR